MVLRQVGPPREVAAREGLLERQLGEGASGRGKFLEGPMEATVTAQSERGREKGHLRDGHTLTGPDWPL